MKATFTPPPPPSIPLIRGKSGAVRPTYWLCSEQGGLAGPYLKHDAHDIVVRNPGTAYLACREGEEWRDADIRLAPKKQPILLRFILVVILLAAALFGAWQWRQTQEHDRLARANAELIEAASAPSGESGNATAKTGE